MKNLLQLKVIKLVSLTQEGNVKYSTNISTCANVHELSTWVLLALTTLCFHSTQHINMTNHHHINYLSLFKIPVLLFGKIYKILFA